MFPSIFTDELKKDFPQTPPIIKSWGLDHVDLRGLIYGKAFENLTAEELAEVKRLLDEHGMQIGCLQSSLAKVHLPGEERQRAEREKLEGVIRAADALGCRLVRAFFFWQPKEDEAGQLAVRPDMLQQVLTMFAPLAKRAKEAGLTTKSSLIVGLGETEQEMAARIQWAHDLGATVGLFAFTPVRGTHLAHLPPPPLPVYRRMQMARWLIVHGLARAQEMSFDTTGALVGYGVPLPGDGQAFRTSGCPDCNRPFYNEQPGGTLYNYPWPPSPAEAAQALTEMEVQEDV